MLKTEMRNEKTMHFDAMSTADMVAIMAEENYNSARAVEAASADVARAVDAVAAAFASGGRLFMIGAGTSGRLGVLDAAECPPTFGVSRDTVVGIIAGGHDCMFRAAEGEEDSREAGIADISSHGVGANDVLIGISVAGGAAYVVGALDEARARGAVTVALTSNADTAISRSADITIFTDTGAEVITGSTRLKAGTAHKMVLNMITTCAMSKTGKVYENMMINLRPSNIKLTARMVRIVREIVGCDEGEAKRLLDAGEWSIRRAVEIAKKT